MSLNASKIAGDSGNNNGMTAPTLEPGTYPARLVQVLAMGLQPQRPHQGKDKPPKPELRVTYELLDEFMLDEDGEELKDKPRWLSIDIPFNALSNDLANSTKHYMALDPKLEHGGDWAKILGNTCMLQVVINPNKKNPDKPYHNIKGISTMRAKEAAIAPELVNGTKVFDPDEPDMEVFGSLPEWIQDKMKNALDYNDSALYTAINGGAGDPTPEPGDANGEAADGDDW